MSEVRQLQLPVPYLGSVNVWLLLGLPLTLVDTGPSNEEALAALEQQLGDNDVALEDLELVLLTHHHLDHSGLAGEIRRRSGAVVAAHRGTARWGTATHEFARAERRFTEHLMAAHGVPDDVVASSAPFFEHILRDSADFTTDRVLVDGEVIEAGGRPLRAVFRPGHSSTDTLFVDEESNDVFIGDHLLAEITSGAEIVPTELPGDERRRALMEYLGNLQKTRAMGIRRAYPGHGPVIDDHRSLIDGRIAFHTERLDLVLGLVRAGRESAFEVARALWSDETANTQPVLVIWEVIGHLDILVNRGTIRESVDGRGNHRFQPKEAVGVATRTA